MYRPIKQDMKPPHFAVKGVLPLLIGERVALTGKEAHHMKDVLRLGPGDLVNLIDAAGYKAMARIMTIDTESVVLEVLEDATFQDDRLPIELIASIIKSDKMDWLIQKATELGVTAIRPVLTAHTVVRLGVGRREQKVARWHEIAIQTLKQCKSLMPPKIHAITHLEDTLIEVCRASDPKALILLDEKYKDKGLIEVWNELNKPTKVVILTGPEGGLSDKETDMCKKAGFVQASLGSRILKAETAAVAAISILGALILHDTTRR
ncbi:16S rRNA (uracil(1498)-N(3))-methyltransferase [Dissulfurimicrobium hydrothermale]|uniref:16S rRNA (uracil(1498)-N(3))-methyltransferase n=1 Tax=Dissulfurimicrobium hydrothermale TaxID=1750598 RepID=UPI001EDBCC3A|nr:16S rRNA (uracil(1498)-N(3))-methyltransferase [Dissulfurimicrobium hydrothermale]UKL14505.1 16S rRNA (uracil(1498)-N(3))-methyltransferase [Dissulfurimicrobium hydrothermale]